jgi:hypothetical protein
MATFYHGKSAEFQLDNAAGSLTNISNTVTEVTLPQSVETGETTAFQQNDKTYVAGLGDSTISVSGIFDATVNTHITAVIAALKAGTVASSTFQYGPAGSASGRPKFTGECIVTSYEVGSPVGDVITYSMEAQVSGSVTVGTY